MYIRSIAIMSEMVKKYFSRRSSAGEDFCSSLEGVVEVNRFETLSVWFLAVTSAADDMLKSRWELPETVKRLSEVIVA